MQETLKMMKSILTGKEKELDEKELIKIYKKESLPNILAYFFISNYGLLIKTNKLYPYLDNEDKASFCLQELDKSLNNYNFDSNARFNTYFIKCYKNRLLMETEQMLTDKRKVIFHTYNISDISSMFCYDNVDTIDLDKYNLTNREKEQCILLKKGYTVKDIAYKLNVTVQAIYNINKNIQKKLINYI